MYKHAVRAASTSPSCRMWADGQLSLSHLKTSLPDGMTTRLCIYPHSNNNNGSAGRTGLIDKWLIRSAMQKHNSNDNVKKKIKTKTGWYGLNTTAQINWQFTKRHPSLPLLCWHQYFLTIWSTYRTLLQQLITGFIHYVPWMRFDLLCVQFG